MLRRELRSDVELIHDVHQHLAPIQATAAVQALEPFKLLFLEDPVEPHSTEGLKVVRDMACTPIGMHELYVTIQECLPALKRNWIDYLWLDVNHAGRITGLVKASTLADAFQVKTAFHRPTDTSPPLAHEANMHMDTAIVNFGIQELVELNPRTGGYSLAVSPVSTDAFLSGIFHGSVSPSMKSALPGCPPGKAPCPSSGTEMARSTTGSGAAALTAGYPCIS